MLIKRTKERSQEITPDNRGVIWGKELNGMATDEELYGQYLSGDETGLELLIKKYGDPLWSYVKKKYKLNTTNFLFLCNC